VYFFSHRDNLTCTLWRQVSYVAFIANCKIKKSVSVRILATIRSRSAQQTWSKQRNLNVAKKKGIKRKETDNARTHLASGRCVVLLLYSWQITFVKRLICVSRSQTGKKVPYMNRSFIPLQLRSGHLGKWAPFNLSRQKQTHLYRPQHSHPCDNAS
jgi:hypothetical protein